MVDEGGSITEEALALLADPAAEIRLHRLVHREVDRVLAAMRSDDFASGVPFGEDELLRRVQAYEELVCALGPIAGFGGYWGLPSADDLWPRVIERLADRPGSGTGVWLDLGRYPALLSLYAAGVAAVARRRYRTLLALLTQPVILEHERPKRALQVLSPFTVLDFRLARKLPGLEQHKTPLNDHIFDIVRPWLALPLPSDALYDRAFDEFEYLIGLVSVDTADTEWAPPGRFSWKRGGDLDPGARLAAEAATSGDHADFLAAGLFGGSAERFADVRSKYASILQRSGIAW